MATADGKQGSHALASGEKVHGCEWQLSILLQSGFAVHLNPRPGMSFIAPLASAEGFRWAGCTGSRNRCMDVCMEPCMQDWAGPALAPILQFGVKQQGMARLLDLSEQSNSLGSLVTET